MSEVKATRSVTVGNPEGIHARCATLIAELVRRHTSDVTLIKAEQRVSGAEVLQILLLTAEQGDRLTLEAVGDDAEEVLDELLALFADNFGETQNDTEESGEPGLKAP